MTVERVVLERIAELLRYRKWYRTNRWAAWPDMRHEHEIELRALIRLARAARRLDAATPDPLTAAKYRGWAEAELAGAWGDR